MGVAASAKMLFILPFSFAVPLFHLFFASQYQLSEILSP